MCWWGCAQNHFFLLRHCFVSIYVLYVRVFGVASLYLCFNFVSDLICLRLHVFPEVCMCKWRVLNYFMWAIYVFLFKKDELVMSCQQFAGRHLGISKHVSCDILLCYVVGCDIIAKKLSWTYARRIAVECIGRDENSWRAFYIACYGAYYLFVFCLSLFVFVSVV